MMFCGFTLGSAAGGLLAAKLLQSAGWQSVLIIGGVAPMLLIPVVIKMMPESVRFLVLRGAGAQRKSFNLTWTVPGQRIDAQACYPTGRWIGVIMAFLCCDSPGQRGGNHCRIFLTSPLKAKRFNWRMLTLKPDRNAWRLWYFLPSCCARVKSCSFRNARLPAFSKWSKDKGRPTSKEPPSTGSNMTLWPSQRIARFRSTTDPAKNRLTCSWSMMHPCIVSWVFMKHSSESG